MTSRAREAFQHPAIAALVGATIAALTIGTLTVTGTIDSTGEILARAGVRLTTPTTGPTIKTATADPNGTVTAPRGSLALRTDTGGLYQNTDGATAWVLLANTSQLTTAGDLGAASVDNTTPWNGGDVNVTTEGTIDWAAYSTTTGCDNMESLAYDVWQAKPPGARSGRLWYNKFLNIQASCNGTTGCNSTSLCATAAATAAGTGTITTSTGANNHAAAAVAASLNGILNNPTSTGYKLFQTIPLIEGEAAFTIKWYVKLVDSEASYLIELVENGAVTDSSSGTLSTGGNSTVAFRISQPVTPGTGREAFVRLTLTNTLRGGVNPRMFLHATTMF